MKNATLKKTRLDLIVLLVLLVTMIFLALVLGGNLLATKKIIALLSLSYFLWGVWHHYRLDTLSSKVAIEYLLISLLGGSLVIGLI